METVLTSRNRQLLPYVSDDHREDLFMSSADSLLTKLNDGDCAVLRVKNIVPEMSPRQQAIRIRVEAQDSFQEKTLKLNSLFLDELKLSPGQEWELLKVSDCQSIKKITIEPVNSFAKNELAQMSRSEFIGRCLLVGPENSGKDMLLKTGKGKFFRVREVTPTLDLSSQTILRIEPNTYLNVYLAEVVPGLDLVVIVDATKSMNLKDYLKKDGHLASRIEAAGRVVERLLDWYLMSSSSVSRFGMVAFGNDAWVAYPEGSDRLAQINKNQVNQLCRDVPDLFRRIDFRGSNLIEALKCAESLFEKTINENNHRTLILISDGAYRGGHDLAEIKYPAQPNSTQEVSLAKFIHQFYERKRICIHTVAVGNAEETRKFEPDYYNDDLRRPADRRVQIPNPKVLKQISELTSGRFTTIDEIESFRDLFKVSTGTTIELA